MTGGLERVRPFLCLDGVLGRAYACPMKVTLQYAASHFEDISAAVDRGEEVEILRPGKAPLHLVAAAAERTPERPRSELFASLRGKIELGDEWDSPATNAEIAELFENSVLLPERSALPSYP
jgi:antitoxin (DNA-binding transcriptional repressor) of toxin-antitoxin stability system